MSKDQRHGGIQTWQSNWQWETWFVIGYWATQASKGATLSILDKKKGLAIKMNDQLYVEERVEDIYLEGNSNEANEVIKELLEKNGTLQEEVRKLKREQEI